ncbi:MAG: IPT/TIG domain-containing protein [Chloroflexia bacterium]
MKVQDSEQEGITSQIITPDPIDDAELRIRPTVNNYFPRTGPSIGGTPVTFIGTGFRPRTKVFFAGRQSATVIYINDTLLIAVTPGVGGPGSADIVLRNPSGTQSVIPNGFRYTLGGILFGEPGGTPDQAPLSEMEEVMVEVDEDAPIVVTLLEVESATQAGQGIGAEQPSIVLPPPDPGDIDLRVPPVITSVTPNSGSTNGGTVVRIVGDNFKTGTRVLFGTTPAQRVTFINKRNLEAISPVHVAGNVKVRVVNPSGLMAELRAGFTYVMAPPPVIASIVPSSGPSFGNFGIQVNGANFAPGCQILFGFAIGPANFLDSFTVGFTCPPGFAGSFVSVGVRNPDGQQFIANGAFRYNP